ncbi:hypothetical protein [Pedobacter sp. GR22-10]|uniref:hypothetical protein n=1 Tax=Pedobacter sp. GR22-10 TaxID=2994472 RepID=UPI00224709D8|nr:hypothetical protein [Pedobacter sp. GR22-10]MCX2430869.1 hypothetical protein [Pedobacter sp. GR22-10]
MSNLSHPKPVKNSDRIGSDHKHLKESYMPASKRKFEGWPILWILLILLLTLMILWYTGKAAVIMEWIEKK